MCGSEFCVSSFWWIVPVVMMILCFFMMRGRRETIMSGFGCCGRDWQRPGGTPSAGDILDRRFASGEIDQVEYEEKKKALTGPAVADTDGNPSNEGAGR